MRSMGRNQLLPCCLCSKDLRTVVTIGVLDLAKQILFMLSGRLGAFETKLATLLVARLHPVILLCQRVIFGLGLLCSRFCFYNPLLRSQTGLFPLLTTLFDIRRELVEIVSHLVKRHGELQAMVGHSVVKAVQFINAVPVCSLTVLRSLRSVVKRT